MDTTQPTTDTRPTGHALVSPDARSFIEATAALILADTRSGALRVEDVTPEVTTHYVVACYERHGRMLDAVGEHLARGRSLGDDGVWEAMATRLHALLSGEAVAS